MPKSSIVGLCACAIVIAVASPALAQPADVGMLPNGAILEWRELFIPTSDEDDTLIEPPDPDTLRFRLNLASCECSRQGAGNTDLVYEIAVTPSTNTSPPGQLWVGSNCEDDIQRPMNCRQVDDIGDLDQFAIIPGNITFRLYDTINASPDAITPEDPEDPELPPCRQANGEAFVWVISDTDGDSDPDFFSPRPVHLDRFPNDVTGFDTEPPPLPDNIRATGGEDSIELEWETPLGNQTDLFGFHALCLEHETRAPVGDGGGALYRTTDDLCGLPQTFEIPPTVVTDDAATPIAAVPAEFASLDSGFICGTVENGTAQSLRIEGLENGVEYEVALVVVDRYGNATATFLDRTVTPQPVTDFWEDLHERGGEIEGGFCSTGSPASLGLVALMLGLLGLRRRRGAVAATVLALGILAPAGARADDFMPYWEDPATQDTSLDTEGPTWHVGIRVGPYVPAIDDQIGRNEVTGQGPYQAMFGNYYIDGVGHDAHVYQILPMLDVDRFIWTGAGQLAIGGSLGYMQKSAFAYADGTNPNQLTRERSTAARNTFRLIPFALTATYRASQLDDLFGIPVVPYIKGGLSYYVWWLDGPNGDVARVCEDGSMDLESCDANKAYGGSFGLQGSIGLSIRAERVDPDAARSMIASGIYHAGFYAEWMVAKVDGFGSSKKLSVGDSTWFAGIDFEF